MTKKDDFEDFLARVSGRRKLRELNERGGGFSPWPGVAMLGIFGWMIVVPMLLGIFLGRWMDETLHHGIFWTLAFMMLGLIVGACNVWRAMHER
ncbi:MAG: AtpZ/AtpI family protein [Pseudomonadota bacterium]